MQLNSENSSFLMSTSLAAMGDELRKLATCGLAAAKHTTQET